MATKPTAQICFDCQEPMTSHPDGDWCWQCGNMDPVTYDLDVDERDGYHLTPKGRRVGAAWLAAVVLTLVALTWALATASMSWAAVAAVALIVEIGLFAIALEDVMEE